MLRRHPLGQKNLTALRRVCPLPRDTKGAIRPGLLPVGGRIWFAGEVDDQLPWLNLHAGDLRINEASVVNGLRRFEVFPNRSDD
jgi:hypothetical protein